MTTLTEFKEIEAKATRGPLEICEHNWSDTSIYNAEGKRLCGFNIHNYGEITEENQEQYENIVRAHVDKFVVSYDALPALIAVAEGMAEALKVSALSYEILVQQNKVSEDDGSITDFSNKALAAFEAWKNEIEKEPGK